MRFLSGTVLQGATRFTVKLMIVAAATVGGGALVSSSVFAALSAEATGSTSVTTGTLTLTAGSGGIGGGFNTAITAMAPGDTVNRFVNIVNGGTLAGLTPSLKILASGSTALNTGSAALQVNIQSCGVAWTSGSAGGCASPTNVLGTPGSGVFISTLATGSTLSNMTLTAGATNRLMITLSLPAGNEVITNGVIPGTSVLGVTTTLNWTFTEQQRASTNTDS